MISHVEEGDVLGWTKLLVRLGMYSSMVNFICYDVLKNNARPFTNITSAARVTFLLRSRISWGISTYSMTTGSEVFLGGLAFKGGNVRDKNCVSVVERLGSDREIP